MICIEKVEDLVDLVRERHRPIPLACAGPEDAESLESLRSAADAGMIKPLAVGRKQAIITCAQTLGIPLDGFEFQDVPEQSQIALRATATIREGRARILMKGHLPTKSVIRAVLDHQLGLRGERMLSHVALFDAPPSGKCVVVTDAGVNIRPSLSQKIEIIRNAADVLHRLGVKRPKVAMLAAIEHVNVASMPATLDAKLIERMSESGLIGEVVAQGPLALDDAVSPEVARSKGLAGPVAGNADIVVAPEIETANAIYKSLTCFAGLEGASIIWGAAAPVVVPGRADTARMKFLSIALACAIIGN
ncbi:MAG: phosphate acyltransferase [Planctomycetota bacterium]